MYFFHNIDILAMAVLTAVRVMRGLLGAGARIGRGEGSYLVRRVGGALLASTLYFLLRFLTGNLYWSVWAGGRPIEYWLGLPWTKLWDLLLWSRAARREGLLREIIRLYQSVRYNQGYGLVNTPDRYANSVLLSLTYMVPYWGITIGRAVRKRRNKKEGGK